MPKLTNGDEQKLLDGVKQAVRHVDDDGMSPNDALMKMARDMSLTPGFLRAAVSAFNNGRQVSQWKANTSVLDKLAEFPLANYDDIHESIWGGTEKEANDKYVSLGDEIHSDYQKAPQWAKEDDLAKLATMDLGLEKVAEDEEVPEYIQDHENSKKMHAAWNDYAHTKRAHEEARGRHSAATDRLGIRLNVLTNYFKKFAQDRLPFDVVDRASKSYYGSRGESLMDIVAERFPTEKRAADTKRYWDQPLNRDAEPFTFIAGSIEAAKDLHAATAALGMAKQAWEEAKEALVPFVPAPTQPKSEKDTTFSISLIDGGAGEKEAGLGENIKELAGKHPIATGAVGGALGYGAMAGRDAIRDRKRKKKEEEEDEKEKEAGTMLGMLAGGAGAGLSSAVSGGDALEKSITKTERQLNDPQHEDELRKIKAQVMLSEMMGDPDNPISEYPPEEVLARYNELAQLAPRISEQSAAVQPLLAKRLAGQAEPFEIKEINDIEQGLKDTSTLSKEEGLQAGPTILKASHDSILG